MTHKLRGVRIEEYAYYVNKLCQNVSLEIWIWRQIVTSQKENTKYKCPPYTTDRNTLPLKFLTYATASMVVLLDILFVLQVKFGTFLSIHRCVFWSNLKYICVVMQVKLLEWNFWHGAELVQSYKSGRVFRVGLRLKFVKIFWAYKTFL